MAATHDSLTPFDHATCRILVCDDSIADVRYLVSLLESFGYRGVATVTDPRQVMPLLGAASFDLILLDMKMPHLDGLDIIALVRQKFSGAELPILVITGAESNETRNAALQAGANDYLAKPIDPIEMSLRAKNLLSIRIIHRDNLAIRDNLEREVVARTAKLDMLIENGLLMAMTRERSTLVRHTLFEGQRLLHCDAASMYAVTDRKTLSFVMRTRDDPIAFSEIPLFDADTGLPNERHVSTCCALRRQSVLIDDVYKEAAFDLSGTRSFDEHSGYRTVSMPMAPRGGEVVGVLQFINKLDPQTGAIISFPPDLVPLVEALAARRRWRWTTWN